MGTRPAAAEATDLERRLNEARAGGRRLFVPYLTAGLPSPQRFVDLLSEGSGGVVYAGARLGVTGEQATLGGAALAVVVRIRPHTRLPVLLGIGISNGEQAAAAARVADGVIVGSAIMKRVLNGEPDR